MTSHEGHEGETCMASQLLIATFSSREEMLRAFDALTMKHTNHIKHAAVISRPNENEVVIMDDDLSPDEGAIAGSAMGAAMMGLGVLQMGAWVLPGVGPFLAVGAGALAGALIGNLTGRFAATLIDFGFDNEQIEAVAKRLGTGQPALVVEFDESVDMATVRQDLAPFGGEIVDPGSNRTVEDVLPQPNVDAKIDTGVPGSMSDIPASDRPVDPLVDVPAIPLGAAIGGAGGMGTVGPVVPLVPVVPAENDIPEGDRPDSDRDRDLGAAPMNPIIP
jgi:uncharacterized membrane protein